MKLSLSQNKFNQNTHTYKQSSALKYSPFFCGANNDVRAVNAMKEKEEGEETECRSGVATLDRAHAVYSVKMLSGNCP